ncbi:hypothetical protein SO574_01145 [Vibrio alfacsensis]|uniref:hypothetical protein n=1 Tax=Vibrio alfacsensis TaxID=1074311 RepID=UPI002ADD3A2C|nr:hypothetical protein [Vibrio alfacsensis]WQE76439.1 hypothetical protein SO574_01145 [Vibrio alfacsensis]
MKLSECRSSKYKNLFILSLLFIMFNHGALYYITGDIYNKDNPIKIIKYTLVLGLLLLYFYHILNNGINKKALVFISMFSVWLIVMLVQSVYFKLPIERALFFYFPCLMIFAAYQCSFQSVVNVLKWTFLFSFIFSILEYLILFDISSRFNQSGFRSISIFVNPNAFGATIVLITTVLLNRVDSTIKQAILLFSSFIMISLSGSKTALLAFTMIVLFFFSYQLLIFLKVKKVNLFRLIKLLVIVSIVLFIFMYLCIHVNNTLGESINIREFSLGSGGQRMLQYQSVALAIDNCPLLPSVCDDNVYVDNGFLFIWLSVGFVSFIGFVSILFLFIYISARFRLEFFLFFSTFLIMALSTNLFNIWPTAYLFWLLSGYLLKDITLKE